MRAAARCLIVLALLVVSASAGCVRDAATPPVGESGTRLPDEPPIAENVTLAGQVVDARGGGGVPNATVRVDLVMGDPCGAPTTRLAWQSWDLPVREDGGFGPLTVPAPRGNASFQYHARAPDHVAMAREVRYLPAEGGALPVVRLALVPSTTVLLPGDARGLAAWWEPGHADAFTPVAEHDGNLTTASGLVHGAVVNATGDTLSWRSESWSIRTVGYDATASPNGSGTEARTRPLTYDGATDNFTVHVRDARGGAVAGAFVLVVGEASGVPYLLARSDDAEGVRVDVPEGVSVLVHAMVPGPVPARAVTLVTDPALIGTVTVRPASPACDGAA